MILAQMVAKLMDCDVENMIYDRNDRPAESSFTQYKVPTRLDMGQLKVVPGTSHYPRADRHVHDPRISIPQNKTA